LIIYYIRYSYHKKKKKKNDLNNHFYFSAGKFVESIDALQKLSEEIAPEIDVKVQHNLVLAGFVSGKYSPKEFETNLRNLLISLTETLEKKKDKKNVDESSFSLEREASFIRYNLAACLFQQKQYAAASIVLEVLLRNIEPIDEKVAMHVCFLYLDIILHSSRGCITSEKERQATMKKAQSIMTYLEKPHGFNRQSVMKGSPIDSNSTSSTSTISTTTSSTTTTTNTTSTTTTTTTNDSNESGSSPDGTNGSGINTSNTTNMDIIEFRFRMHLYKSKLFLLESNLKTAKKEVKSALEIFQKEIKSRSEKQQEDTPMILSSEKTSITIGHPSLAVQNATGLFLKANMEYLRKNYPKCIKLLASCSQSAVDEVSTSI
jgi:CCR4-NOT transcription complex subunit 10